MNNGKLRLIRSEFRSQSSSNGPKQLVVSGSSEWECMLVSRNKLPSKTGRKVKHPDAPRPRRNFALDSVFLALPSISLLGPKAKSSSGAGGKRVYETYIVKRA